MCTPKTIFLYLINFYLLYGSCDRPEDAQSSGNNRISDKNSVIFKSVCFYNDCVTTQHAPKCADNCSDH